MAKGGVRENSGRKAGVPDKAKQMIAEILETLNCDPLKNLARIANGTPIKTGNAEEEYPKVSEQLAANKELLNYIHPKLTSTTLSGDPKKPLEFKGLTVTVTGVAPNANTNT